MDFCIAIIYSPMPSLRVGDLGSLVNDICEIPTKVKWFVYWIFILQLKKKIILPMIWLKD